MKNKISFFTVLLVVCFSINASYRSGRPVPRRFDRPSSREAAAALPKRHGWPHHGRPGVASGAVGDQRIPHRGHGQKAIMGRGCVGGVCRRPVAPPKVASDIGRLLKSQEAQKALNVVNNSLKLIQDMVTRHQAGQPFNELLFNELQRNITIQLEVLKRFLR